MPAPTLTPPAGHSPAQGERHSPASATITARSMHLSQGTVRNHLSAAIQKLGARNRAEAADIAQRKGWL